MSFSISAYTLFRLPQVINETGYARSTIWRQIKCGHSQRSETAKEGAHGR